MKISVDNLTINVVGDFQVKAHPQLQTLVPGEAMEEVVSKGIAKPEDCVVEGEGYRITIEHNYPDWEPGDAKGLDDEVYISIEEGRVFVSTAITPAQAEKLAISLGNYAAWYKENSVQ